MSHAVDHLWSVAQSSPHVDAEQLARAIENAAVESDAVDYRTRLLCRDGIRALRAYWGNERLQQWLKQSPAHDAIARAVDDACLDDDPNEIGFPSLLRNVVDATQPEQISRFFRDLSRKIRRPVRLVVGGSIPLILGGYLTRGTQDIDVVDEVPAELRNEYAFLDELMQVHRLQLAHFQSHYLPRGWDKRLRSLGKFGEIEVFLVDPHDIFVSKLFSARLKDKGDLLTLASKLDRLTLARRVAEDTKSLRADEHLLSAAVDNWYVLFGEPLPT